MSTTVGHAICGITCLLAGRRLVAADVSDLSVRSMALFAILANLPDLDMVVSYAITGNPLYYHGQVSHSLLFSAFVGLLVMLVISKQHNARTWLLYTSPLLLHVLMDSLTGPEVGAVPSRGVALLWPIIIEPIPFPVTLMNGPHHDTWDRFFDMHNVKVVMYEIIIFTPLLFLAWRAYWRRSATY